MWKWQHVFQYEVSWFIKSVFQTIELQIPSHTFVIGIPVNPNHTDRIFFQKEDCGFVPNDFKDVFSIAKNYYDNDPEQNFWMSAAHLNQAHKQSLYPKAVRNAVQSILKLHDTRRKLVSFCSFPIQKNEHWVMTVIQLNQQDFDNQYRLTKEIHEVHSMRKYRVDRCFLEAIIYRILKESEDELQRPSEGNVATLANSQRVIEDAAYELLKSIEVHINQWNRFDLLSFANNIAAERYEGEGSKGRLIICPRDHPDISVEVKLKTPISIFNYRAIRKLLEVSSTEMALLCDIETVWGLGTPLDTYKPSLENLFEIRFTEHYTWELVHADNVMLHVKYRRPRIPKERFDRRLFYDHVDRFFNVDENRAKLLSEAVEAAVEQRHGTMLVITPEAEAETMRLETESTSIETKIISRKIISHVSSIDGAILISPDGNIYSFGVILDGESSKNGNSARGARFNSAIRYVEGKKKRNIDCLALIVSEDGYVNLYPTLRRRIPRAGIEELLDELEQYANLKPFDSDKAWSTLVKLRELDFYLLEQDIERANKIKDKIVELENQDRANEMSRTGIGYIFAPSDDFKVNPEMDLTYYLPDKSI